MELDVGVARALESSARAFLIGATEEESDEDEEHDSHVAFSDSLFVVSYCVSSMAIAV